MTQLLNHDIELKKCYTTRLIILKKKVSSCVIAYNFSLYPLTS